MPHATRIAELLIDIGAVKLSLDPPFTWTSGIKSPVYCDNRMIYSHPDARTFVVHALTQRVKCLQVPPDVIAGTATSAIGWGSLVAYKLHLPFAYVRGKAKGHGSQKRVEGDIKPGKHVVLIEDLLSTGGSAIDAVQALREDTESIVTDVVAIFSYELPQSAEKAQQCNVKLHPLSTFSTLLDVAYDQGKIDAKELAAVRSFIKDPERWGK